MSEKFMNRLMDILFKDITDRKWYITSIIWLIDSKFRRYKRVDKFLAEQVNKPDANILAIAIALRGKGVYDTAHRIEEWVYRNFAYKTDSSYYKMIEYWASVKETYKIKSGDCDDLNSMIYVLCRLAGISEEIIYCALGNTTSGYHFYCLMYHTQRRKWVKLDATFHPEIKKIHLKADFKGKWLKYYNHPDYIFNEERVYAFK